MPVAELTSLITSAKVAYDIAKGIGSLQIEVERNKSISELLNILISVQSDALSMQEKHSSLIQEKDGFQKKLLDFENWDNDQINYIRKEVTPHCFVYIEKKANQSGENPPWYCPNCWNDRKKSILNYDASGVAHHHSCVKCDYKFSIRKPERNEEVRFSR